jgi:hypothetical protein
VAGRSAEALCWISAGAFFLAALAAGVWKYACIARSPDARAPAYVDTAHRAALMYAFACALLAELVARSAWSNAVNLAAAAIVIAFFAAAVLGYAVHGLLRDTENQLARPHRLGRRTIPPAAMVGFMVVLAAAEIGGFSVVFAGYLAS